MSHIGIPMALGSAVLSGSSIVLQKTGLVESIGLERGFLTNKYWWLGTGCLVLSEILNFIAYAYSPAILVTPLGAVSVAVSALLSVVFLKERLNFSGAAGISLCIMGSTIIVLHGPKSTATSTIPEFFANVFLPGFIVYFLICFATLMYLIIYAAPRYGTVNPFVYVSMTSICGAFLVNAAQGFGSSIVHTVTYYETDSQLKYWGLYALFGVIMVAVCFQIIYLNKALVNFSTSVVTPLTFVFFSTMTLITSAVLYRGFNVSSAVNGVTIVLGFLVIVVGVGLIFQYNLKLTKLAQELVGEPELEENPLAVIQESFLHEGKHPAFRKQTTRESIPISGSPSATNIRLVSVSGHSLTLPRSRDELVSARNSQTL